jgi:hypothetical protein
MTFMAAIDLSDTTAPAPRVGLHAPQATAASALPIKSTRSLWCSAPPARLVRASGDYAARLAVLTVDHAVIRSDAVCQLGEPVVLTISGLGHISGSIADCCSLGIHIRFDPDLNLAPLIDAWHQRNPCRLTR